MRLTTRKRSAALAFGLVAGLGACNESNTITDLNNLSAEQVSGGLTPTTYQLLVTGLLNRDRDAAGQRYIVFSETMARDIFRLDPAEPRFITELLGAPPDAGGFVGGSGGTFTENYSVIRTANTLITGADSASFLTDAQKAGTRGFARTFKALALYRTLELRDSVGIPIDVEREITDTPADYVCKPSALAAISALLDSAATDLRAGGASFAFTLPGGFTSNGTFNTPATFLRFNRGLKAKVEVYRGLEPAYRSSLRASAGSIDRALATFDSSFIDVTAPLDRGVYRTYSAAPGETTNPIADAAITLTPYVADSIQAGDARASKITTRASITRSGVTTTYTSTLTSAAANQTRPIPILRNAELILLRAQAQIEKGNLEAARADINVVRQGEGRLAPIATPFASKRAAIDAVLYEKRYSLLLEGPQRLVDLRAYGRLNSTYFRPARTGDTFTAALPIPKTEVDARGGTVNVVCQ